MPITFNTNLSALGAQRNINISSNNAANALAKLSSGSRIPTAKDDAAGLAIGSKLKAEVAGLTQASNNTGQAISLLQIADGALSTTADILVRMKTLATQASSGQLADADRSLLNQEYVNLRTEIERIAQTSNFNGATLLNGGDVVATQAEGRLGGLNSLGITLTPNTQITAADAVYAVRYDYTANADPTPDVGNLTVINLTTGENQTIDVASAIRALTAEPLTNLTTNLAVGQTVDIAFNALGITLKLDQNFDVDTDKQVTIAADPLSTAQANLRNNTSITYLTNAGLTGAQLAAMTTLNTTTGLLQINVADNVNNIANIQATAGLQFSTDGITFTNTLAVDVSVAGAQVAYVRAATGTTAFARIDFNATASVTGASGAAGNNFQFQFGTGVVRIQETTTATKNFSFKVGTGTTANDSIGFTLNASTTGALGISASSIGTATTADTAIGLVNTAITSVSSRRADVGAAQSRLEFAANNISVSIQNTTAAQSAILDADISSEITKFTSQNVLVQAGVIEWVGAQKRHWGLWLGGVQGCLKCGHGVSQYQRLAGKIIGLDALVRGDGGGHDETYRRA
jgi:flagellin